MDDKWQNHVSGVIEKNGQNKVIQRLTKGTKVGNRVIRSPFRLTKKTSFGEFQRLMVSKQPSDPCMTSPVPPLIHNRFLEKTFHVLNVSCIFTRERRTLCTLSVLFRVKIKGYFFFTLHSYIFVWLVS